MIETNNLTKKFNGAIAVEDMTLRVEEGEVFGLLGPNGAGKTTTVRLLTCLIAPTAGRASVLGYDITEQGAEIRKRVGILTESPGLWEKLSAYRNLEIYARLYGVPGEKRPAQIQRYLEMLELWDRRDEPVTTFSKGMKQKLAIARALVHEPQVLFLDEPTAALDPEMAKVVRDFISELRGQGRTIFLCTHNLDEAERLCDRIGVLRTRLLAVDTPENLRHSLFGHRTVLRLRNIGTGLIERLRSLDFVHSVEHRDKELVIGLSNPEEENPKLVEFLVEAGAQVQYVTEQRHSLEEVYLTLMAEEEKK